jgi:hypothetical protein
MSVRSLCWCDGSSFNALVFRLLRSQRYNALNEDAGQVDAVGGEVARLNEFLNLGDGDLACHCCQGIEVACTFMEDQVAMAVAA